MQRRALSPLGLRRQRIGRKALANARMAAGIERKLGGTSPSKKSKTIPRHPQRFRLGYTFRRWHVFATLGCIILLVSGSFAYQQIKQAQVMEQKKQADAKHKAEAVAADKRQQCYKSVLATKSSQVGSVTYDQLYGNQCDSNEPQ